MKLVKLFELNKKDKFKFDGQMFVFIKCDGMYAICLNSDGDIVNINCNVRVEVR